MADAPEASWDGGGRFTWLAWRFFNADVVMPCAQWSNINLKVSFPLGFDASETHCLQCLGFSDYHSIKHFSSYTEWLRVAPWTRMHCWTVHHVFSCSNSTQWSTEQMIKQSGTDRFASCIYIYIRDLSFRYRSMVIHQLLKHLSPPENDHISHRKGSSENHQLKSTNLKEDMWSFPGG